MTLIEAYRAIGPLVGEVEVDALRSEAARIMLDAVQVAGRGLTFPREIKEEAEARLVLRLVKRSVSGAKWNDPDSDGAVRAWLRRCLRNECVSILRTLDDQLLDEADRVRAGETEDPQRLEQLSKAVWEQLAHEVLPSAAAGMRGKAGKDLERAFREMLALALRQTSISGVVESQGKTPGEASEATVYKQHQRARERLLAQIEVLAAAGVVDLQRAEHLRNAVRFLRRRA